MGRRAQVTDLISQCLCSNVLLRKHHWLVVCLILSQSRDLEGTLEVFREVKTYTLQDPQEAFASDTMRDHVGMSDMQLIETMGHTHALLDQATGEPSRRIRLYRYTQVLLDR